MFYVYGLRLNDSSEYRYVGSTEDMDTRLYHHFADARSRGQHHNQNLQKWLNENGPGRVVMESLQEIDSNGRRAEQSWIAKLSKEGHRLFNLRMAHNSTYEFSELPDERKAAIIEQYLDAFEKDTDKPWLKERGPVYFA